MPYVGEIFTQFLTLVGEIYMLHIYEYILYMNIIYIYFLQGPTSGESYAPPPNPTQL